MRVAFVNLQLHHELSGVTRAIAGQAKACAEAQLPIDFWVVNPSRDGLENGIHFARYDEGHFGARASRLVKARLLRNVRALEGYEVVLLRYPLAIDVDPLAWLKHTQSKIITVHHTREIDELLSGGRTVGSLARAAIEAINGRRVLRRVAGVAAVTDEIRHYQLSRSGLGKPSRTVANGIDVGGVKHTGFVPFDGVELKLLFIASSQAPWHGIDRLLASVRAYRGPVRLTLNLVGGASGQAAGTVQRQSHLTLVHHGLLHGAALDAVFEDTTLAVSSLAMFRTGLTQACVLKTREYVARGVPFVYGYDDVDLPSPQPFCLNVGNSDAPFDIEPVVELARRASATPGLSQTMRAFASERLDWKVKMKAFHELALEVG
jgi:hypothetical protein